MNAFSNFLENFYDVIFTPDKAFTRLKENPPLFQAFIIVLVISILNPVMHFIPFNGIGSIILFALGLIVSAFAGVVSWLLFASFLEMIASIFKQSGKLSEFLTLSAFSLIPWIFLGPVELFKSAGLFGTIIGAIIGFVVWLWVVILFIAAIMKAYDLSFGRVLVLAVVPFISAFLAFNWIIGFFTTLIQIVT